MQVVHVEGMKYYRNERWSHLKHGIFTRHGGVSSAPWTSLNLGGTVGDKPRAVRQNHDRVYSVLEVAGQNACTTWQVHGADVVYALKPLVARRWLDRADGVVTNKPDLPLVMRYADCVPLIYYDPIQRAIGLAHAGWRGTVQGMAANMVRAMESCFDSNPNDIQVIIGPSISQDAFQVGEEVVEALHAYFGAQASEFVRRDTADGTAYVDLWAANRLDLQRAGVVDIEVSGICTYSSVVDFYSHRGERGKTGRFGVVISL